MNTSLEIQNWDVNLARIALSLLNYAREFTNLFDNH